MSDEIQNEESIEDQIQVIIEGEEEIPEAPVQEVVKPSITPEDLEQIKKETSGIRTEISEGINNLANVLSRPVSPPIVSPPVETEEDIQATDKKYFKTPTQAVREEVERLQNQKIGPIVEKLSKNNLANCRKIATLSPDTSSIMQAYGEEVDAEVENLPLDKKYLDPDVYNKVCLTVQSRHIKEIMEKAVEDAIQKERETMKKQGFVGKIDNQQPAPKKEVKRFSKDDAKFLNSILDEEEWKKYVDPIKE